MKVIRAKADRVVEIDPIKKIEKIARVCYKSEDKIKEGSAEKMVGALTRSKHYAMLEHGSVIMDTDIAGYSFMVDLINMFREEFGYLVELRATDESLANNTYIISGNMRAWLEFISYCKNDKFVIPVGVAKILSKYEIIFSEMLKDIELTEVGEFLEVDFEDLTEVERMVHEDVTFKFTCDRGVSHEIVRHRKASFAQESTRYCNYNNSGDVVFILPVFYDGDKEELRRGVWEKACKDSELAYHTLIKTGAKPQEARDVLNNSVKTEVVMTANLNEWVHFLNLRAIGTTGKPHPQMEEVAVKVLQILLVDHPYLEYYLEG